MFIRSRRAPDQSMAAEFKLAYSLACRATQGLRRRSDELTEDRVAGHGASSIVVGNGPSERVAFGKRSIGGSLSRINLCPSFMIAQTENQRSTGVPVSLPVVDDILSPPLCEVDAHSAWCWHRGCLNR